jgi:hypothetical protein
MPPRQKAVRDLAAARKIVAAQALRIVDLCRQVGVEPSETELSLLRADELAVIREEAAWAAARPVPRVRPCLTCGTPFESAGAHNRMCDDCRATAGFDSSPFEPQEGALDDLELLHGEGQGHHR